MEPRPARGILAWALKRAGHGGITLPPLGIYVLPEYLGSESLLRHERVHWMQYMQMGAVRYYATYLYQVARYGYHNAPMERQARGET